jgi:hypothetical protein
MPAAERQVPRAGLGRKEIGIFFVERGGQPTVWPWLGLPAAAGEVLRLEAPVTVSAQLENQADTKCQSLF